MPATANPCGRRRHSNGSHWLRQLHAALTTWPPLSGDRTVNDRSSCRVGYSHYTSWRRRCEPAGPQMLSGESEQLVFRDVLFINDDCADHALRQLRVILLQHFEQMVHRAARPGAAAEDEDSLS